MFMPIWMKSNFIFSFFPTWTWKCSITHGGNQMDKHIYVLMVDIKGIFRFYFHPRKNRFLKFFIYIRSQIRHALSNVGQLGMKYCWNHFLLVVGMKASSAGLSLLHLMNSRCFVCMRLHLHSHIIRTKYWFSFVLFAGVLILILHEIEMLQGQNILSEYMPVDNRNLTNCRAFQRIHDFIGWLTVTLNEILNWWLLYLMHTKLLL